MGLRIVGSYSNFDLMVGDGLVFVGVRFGKYRYKTKALFTDKKYFRTFEVGVLVY